MGSNSDLLVNIPYSEFVMMVCLAEDLNSIKNVVLNGSDYDADKIVAIKAILGIEKTEVGND